MTAVPLRDAPPQARRSLDCSLAPIVLFVYNRPVHAQQTVEALMRNELAAESDLIVFCDAARNAAAEAKVQQVRNFVRSITGFKSVRIVERATNLGLANSIIDGVTAICGEYGRVIVLEDDLVTAPSFLRYMNEALDLYSNDAVVGSIHGYRYPVDRPMPQTFFLRGASCWGWATWSRAWRLFEPDGRKLLDQLQRRGLTGQFDLDGAIAYTRLLKYQIRGRTDSWAIRWHASMFLAQHLQLSPGNSLVRNIGFDGSGTHCYESDAFSTEVAAVPIIMSRIPLEECSAARAALIRYYRSTKRSISARALDRLRRIVWSRWRAS